MPRNEFGPARPLSSETLVVRRLPVIWISGVFAAWGLWLMHLNQRHFWVSLAGFIAPARILAGAEARVFFPLLSKCILASVIFAGAYFIGRGILRLAAINRNALDEHSLSALALGLGCISQSLLLGLCGLWTGAVMKILLWVPFILGVFFHRRELAASIKERLAARPFSRFTLWDLLGFGFLANLFLMNLLTDLGPEFYYDGLVYHLAMPQYYLLHHKILPTPTVIESASPFATEMIYGLCLAVSDESLCKLIHAAFGVSLTAMIYRWVKRNADSRTALLAAVLFYGIPMVCFAS